MILDRPTIEFIPLDNLWASSVPVDSFVECPEGVNRDKAGVVTCVNLDRDGMFDKATQKPEVKKEKPQNIVGFDMTFDK